MNLFSKIYRDEDVSVLIAALLQARGFDCVTVRDEKMFAQSDSLQLAHAVALQRCIVTHNRSHFEQLHLHYLAAGQQHFGIIIAARRTHYDLAQRLAILLNTLAADEIKNQLLYS